ncbi:MAG: redox-regulated ATPase YchF [Candidatus Micrarchaeia archaeon]|jgi:ribosome-binding ATPase YchF (GTP1/OBG family)
MLIGIVGAPNKGKTTLFSALTLRYAEISPRPFTTISPNKGVAYVKVECVEKELGVKCNPKNSICINGNRLIPVNVIDVAGLVPGAHLGKGMGNQFLNDLASADALIQVVDATCKTDPFGNPCEYYDAIEEVKFVKEEIEEWLFGILKRNIKKLKDFDEFLQVLSFMKAKREVVEKAIENAKLNFSTTWDDEELRDFVKSFIALNKPIVVALNKIDLEEARKNLQRLKSEAEKLGVKAIPTSAEIELALRRANEKGIVSYVPGENKFEIKEANDKQLEALKLIEKILKEIKTTGVIELLNEVVFGVLKAIVVYPVEDENKFTDHFGNVLPDAILMPNGSKVIELAEKIHSELAQNFLYAIDAKTKKRIGKDEVLKNNDVIKIVAKRK